MQRSSLLLVVLVVLGSLAPTGVRADEIVHADGRRETGKDLRKDSAGRWTIETEGRRVRLAPGDVVAVVDDAGKETDLIPALSDEPLDARQQAALAQVVDPKLEMWQPAAEPLAASPRRAAFDAFLALAEAEQPEKRARGIALLVGLRTRESVKAAAERVLSESHATTRQSAASALFAASEVYRRADLDAVTTRGLAHEDNAVRIAFALLAPPALEAAVPVLEKDGLKNRDHHVRESAAMALGRRGKASGERLLAQMLTRKSIPGQDDPELGTRLLIEEQTAICAIFAKLGTKGAVAALKKATKSPHEAVKKAAEAALQTATDASK